MSDAWSPKKAGVFRKREAGTKLKHGVLLSRPLASTRWQTLIPGVRGRKKGRLAAAQGNGAYSDTSRMVER